MSKNLERYKEIIAIELKDLQKDIEELLSRNKERNEKGEITKYVFLENRVTLKDEINALKSFINTVKDMDASSFESMDEIDEYLNRKFNRMIQEAGYGKGIIYFVKKKLKKVKRYVCK